MPVAYGGDAGPDLESIAAEAGLSADEVAAAHRGRDYPVYMLGFAPVITSYSIHYTKLYDPGETYVHPTGYRIEMQQHPKTGSWRLIGTQADGLLCHKPCTVSGGGKSEIS